MIVYLVPQGTELGAYLAAHPELVSFLRELPHRLAKAYGSPTPIPVEYHVITNPEEGVSTLVAQFPGADNPEDDANALSKFDMSLSPQERNFLEP